MKIRAGEFELIGKWTTSNGKIKKDSICERIDWLIENQLVKLAVSKEYGDWESLFQDPSDNRYWERTYPQSELHGGGPPMLKCLDENEAKEKYLF
jgi:hypothetical protein